jgi:hypothetical protein
MPTDSPAIKTSLKHVFAVLTGARHFVLTQWQYQRSAARTTKDGSPWKAVLSCHNLDCVCPLRCLPRRSQPPGPLNKHRSFIRVFENATDGKQINQIINAVPSIFQALQPFSVLRKAGLRQATASFILITRTEPVSTLRRNPEVALALVQGCVAPVFCFLVDFRRGIL